MRMNLGRTIIVFIFLTLSLYSQVTLKAPNSFVQGDFVEFQLSASGKQVEFPTITKIEDYPVQSLGKSMQTNIVNGKMSQQITQRFAFKPEKDVTIPSFEIEVNGQIEKTEPKKLIMSKVTKTVSDLFDFEIEVDKTTPFVGEDILLTVTFKYRKDLNIVDLEFQKPNFGGFWVKQLKEPQTNIQKDPKYHYQSLQFLLFPQKAGKLELGPFKIGVVTMSGGVTNSFFLNGSTNKQAVYSNSVTLDVKSLPQDVRLVGEFNLETSVDKLSVKKGEAISYKVSITGYGNMDDIPDISLDIPAATIYENPAKKEFSYKEGSYSGSYTKVFSIVPSRDIVLPSVEVKYLDKKSSKVKTMKGQSYEIKVEGVPNKQAQLQTFKPETTSTQLTIDQEKRQTPLDLYEKVTYFLLGVGSILGIILIWKLIQNLRAKKVDNDNIPLYKKINRVKSKNELLQIMAIYINIDKDLDKIIYEIEQVEDPKLLQNLKKEAVKTLKAKDIKGNI